MQKPHPLHSVETLRICWADETIRFYALLGGCLLLTRLPVAGKYFRLLATMAHEGGHVLMALLLREKPHKVSLFQDTSGVAWVESTAHWKALLVALSGYPLPALTAFLCFWLLRHGHAAACVWGVTIVTGLFLLFYIRNAFGIMWSLSFMALHIFLLYKKSVFCMGILAQTDTFVLWIESVTSTLILTRIAWSAPKQAGDASNISKITHLPSLLVALLFFALNAWIAYCCIIRFFPV